MALHNFEWRPVVEHQRGCSVPAGVEATPADASSNSQLVPPSQGVASVQSGPGSGREHQGGMPQDSAATCSARCACGALAEPHTANAGSPIVRTPEGVFALRTANVAVLGYRRRPNAALAARPCGARGQGPARPALPACRPWRPPVLQPLRRRLAHRPARPPSFGARVSKATLWATWPRASGFFEAKPEHHPYLADGAGR